MKVQRRDSSGWAGQCNGDVGDLSYYRWSWRRATREADGTEEGHPGLL